MSIRKSIKRNKFRKAVFFIITALIAIGLVVPLAGLFQKQPVGGGAQNTGQTQQTMQEKLTDLEAKA